MKCFRLKAACAVTLVLLSLTVNAYAYGSGKGWKGLLFSRASERLTNVLINKLPPRLTKTIMTAITAGSVIYGGYLLGDTIYLSESERPRPIEKTADFTEALLRDRNAIVITGEGVDLAKLQRVIEQLQREGAVLGRMNIVGEETLAKLENLLKEQAFEREGEVIWLELSEDNALHAFSYDHTKQINLNSAVIDLVLAITGTVIFFYGLNLITFAREYQLNSLFTHYVTVTPMVGGGVLLMSAGFVKAIADLGLL